MGEKERDGRCKQREMWEKEIDRERDGAYESERESETYRER